MFHTELTRTLYATHPTSPPLSAFPQKPAAAWVGGGVPDPFRIIPTRGACPHRHFLCGLGAGVDRALPDGVRAPQHHVQAPQPLSPGQ